MDLLTVCKILGSKTRLNILKILSKKSNISSVELYRFYNKQFPQKRRETIYNELERLTNSGLIEKKYLKMEKKLVYNLNKKNLKIDLLNQNISEI